MNQCTYLKSGILILFSLLMSIRAAANEVNLEVPVGVKYRTFTFGGVIELPGRFNGFAGSDQPGSTIDKSDCKIWDAPALFLEHRCFYFYEFYSETPGTIRVPYGYSWTYEIVPGFMGTGYIQGFYNVTFVGEKTDVAKVRLAQVVYDPKHKDKLALVAGKSAALEIKIAESEVKFLTNNFTVTAQVGSMDPMVFSGDKSQIDFTKPLDMAAFKFVPTAVGEQAITVKIRGFDRDPDKVKEVKPIKATVYKTEVPRIALAKIDCNVGCKNPKVTAAGFQKMMDASKYVSDMMPVPDDAIKFISIAKPIQGTTEKASVKVVMENGIKVNAVDKNPIISDARQLFILKNKQAPDKANKIVGIAPLDYLEKVGVLVGDSRGKPLLLLDTNGFSQPVGAVTLGASDKSKVAFVSEGLVAVLAHEIGHLFGIEGDFRYATNELKYELF